MPVTPPSTPPPSPGTQWAAIDIINSALRLLRVKASGEPITGDEANDGIAALNQMVDSWNAQRLMIYTVNRTVFVPASLKQAYTLGTGGDFNLARPARIENLTVLNLGNPAAPAELPLDSLTDEEWAAIPVKNVSSALPNQVWDDGGFPFRTLSYFPIPNVQVNFVVYSWAALTIFPDLTSQFTFPPAYLKALRYNLAVDLAGEFGADPAAHVVAQALSSMAVIKTLNVQPLKIMGDSALSGQGHYDWRTDQAISR